MKVTGFYVSRADRIGDLVLSLPVLGLLRDAGVPWLGLHVSTYAADVGLWAFENDLCDAVFTGPEGTLLEGRDRDAREGPAAGLALFHSPDTRAFFRTKQLAASYGPRTKLSALWAYTRSLAQNRSRVERSECVYNLELARWALWKNEVPLPEIRPLSALRLPSAWRSPRPSPDVIVVATNRGSAQDWPFEKYLEWIDGFLQVGARVDVLLNGVDAPARSAALRASGRSVGIVENFPRLRELIAFLAGAKLVVSSSTGPLHLAHAAGVPVVGIYPTSPKVETFDRWRPEGYAHAAPVRFIEIGRETSWSPAGLWSEL